MDGIKIMTKNMIDCSKTENYFTERQRMTKRHKLNIGIYVCELNCVYCPLSGVNNGTNFSCTDFERLYPEKAIAIMQKWSDEHPQKTYLSEFLKNYPNASLNDAGLPQNTCPFHLGLISIDDCRKYHNCTECWNQPIKESEEND